MARRIRIRGTRVRSFLLLAGLLAAWPAFSQDTIHELVKRAIFKAQIGDFPAALKDLDAAIGFDSTRSEPWYNKGVVESEMTDYQSAIGDFQTAARYHPGYPEPWLGMAEARSALGDHAGAIVDYNKAISLRPEDADPYFNRGLEFLAVSNWTDAILDFTRVTHVQPANPLAWYNLGLALFRTREFTRADSVLLVSARLDSLSAETWITLGASKGAQGAYTEAMTCLDRALAIKPEDPDALYNKALVLLYLKRFLEAEPEFSAVIAADSTNPAAWEGRGVARQYNGDATGACEDWKQARQLGSAKAEEYLKKFCSP